MTSSPVLITDRSPSTARQPRLAIGEWILALGIAALLLPTLLRLAQLSWSTEAGAHGPIVFATGLWLLWRDRAALQLAVRRPFLPAGLALVVLLPLYAVGRITSVLMIESLSLYGVLITLAYLRWGEAVIRRLWFPIFYGLFLITPPENWIFVLTRPIKVLLSTGAVDLLAWAGFAIGSTGSMIQIEGYQLLVATACSGINSLIGISAISLFYVYLRHDDAPRYALVLTVLVLPIAVLTNFARIIILILVTYWFGEDIAQGIAHEAAGILMFVLALTLFLALDTVLHPLFRRLGWTR
ncbi:exosortase V [Sphingomonas qilianensis]|uniref:Exosortase V n=1 Tax=Sphingomonas qilianensis TaxID=1736690 RepID=A0ABU9XP18_9SPHN